MMVKKGICSSNISLEWQGEICLCHVMSPQLFKLKTENHSYTIEICFYGNFPLYPPLSLTEERWILEEFAQIN